MNQINQDQINIGNETAIDLLVTQNKSKAELATNLQGLGVSADANTDTLEELAYKVSTVSADTSKQKPQSLAVDMAYSCDSSDNWNFGYFVEKNGWIFFRYSNTIKRRKLSELKSTMTTYNTTKTAGFQSSSIGSSYDASGNESSKETFFLNDSGSNLYVMCNNTVKVYSVTGYDGTALTLTSTKTLTPRFDGSGININYIDINASETQMVVCDTDGNIGIFDLTGSNTQNLLRLNSIYYGAVVKFANDTNNSLVVLYNSGSTYEINFWTFDSNGQVTVTSSNSVSTNNAGYDRWERAFCKYKDLNNHYKILFNFKYKKADDNSILCLGVIDCATNTFNIINSCINTFSPEHFNDLSLSTPIVTIVNGYYYVLAGECFVAFDSNWNEVGYCINKLYNTNYDNSMYYTMIYDGDFYNFGEGEGTVKCMKHKLWLNKLIVYSRDVAVNGFVKQIPYFATLTEYDLDNGLYNQ